MRTRHDECVPRSSSGLELPAEAVSTSPDFAGNQSLGPCEFHGTPAKGRAVYAGPLAAASIGGQALASGRRSFGGADPRFDASGGRPVGAQKRGYLLNQRLGVRAPHIYMWGRGYGRGSRRAWPHPPGQRGIHGHEADDRREPRGAGKHTTGLEHREPEHDAQQGFARALPPDGQRVTSRPR